MFFFFFPLPLFSLSVLGGGVDGVLQKKSNILLKKGNLQVKRSANEMENGLAKEGV